MIDLILCTIPSIELRGPPMGPAQLKSYLENKGFSIKCFDFNIDLWHYLEQDKSFFKIDKIHYFTEKDEFDKFYPNIRPRVMEWVNQLINLSPSWVGISVHDQRTEHLAFKICEELREINPQQKIVMGGTYCGYIGKKAFDSKLIDKYIIGEGEYALFNLLSGTNEKEGEVNITALPPADYTDYNFSLYPQQAYDIYDTELGLTRLYVQGSRSCVRRCDFCNIPQSHGSWRYKSGEQVANEVIWYYEKYGIKEFIFADNLINGNFLEFRIFLKALIDYYQEKNIKPFSWDSHFIIRSIKQTPEEDIKLLADSGCRLIKVGIESGSFSLRQKMNKAFKNEDLFHLVKLCSRYKILMRPLLFVGHPFETLKDFHKTLELTKDLSKYKDIFYPFCIGSTLQVAENTTLKNDLYYNMGIISKDPRFPREHIHMFWRTDNNDVFLRLERHREFKELAESLGYMVEDPLGFRIERIIKQYGHLKD